MSQRHKPPVDRRRFLLIHVKGFLAIGVKGRTDGLCDASLGLKIERDHVVTDFKPGTTRNEAIDYKTSVEGIYAVGDVIGIPSLASAAYVQGRAAALHSIGDECAKLLAQDIPTGIYTSPEISSVGRTESALTADRAIEMSASGLPTTFVPARNLVFLTVAAAHAYRRGIDVLVAGVCETDFSGYPDCRRDTIEAQERALALGLEPRVPGGDARGETRLAAVRDVDVVVEPRVSSGGWSTRLAVGRPQAQRADALAEAAVAERRSLAQHPGRAEAREQLAERLLDNARLLEQVEHQAGQVAEVCRHCAARDVHVARSTREREALWSGRKNAFGAIGRYRGGIFRSWLLRITANASYDILRRAQRRPTSPLPDAEEGAAELPDVRAADPVAEAARSELYRHLEAALQLLPDDQRMAVVLCDVYGMDYAEVAAATSSALGTVKSRIHRGRLRLRELMAEHRELFLT